MTDAADSRRYAGTSGLPLEEFYPLTMTSDEFNHTHQVMDADTAHIFQIVGSLERAQGVVATLGRREAICEEVGTFPPLPSTRGPAMSTLWPTGRPKSPSSPMYERIVKEAPMTPALLEQVALAIDSKSCDPLTWAECLTLAKAAIEAITSASAGPQAEAVTISAMDPRIIIAGIRRFGLAPDGSDLRDLERALAHPQPQQADGREPVITVNDLRQWQYDTRVPEKVRKLAGDAADEIERLQLQYRTRCAQADGREAVIEECAKVVDAELSTYEGMKPEAQKYLEPDDVLRCAAARIRALSQSATDGAFTQCEKCWQPATCKKYGCREPAVSRPNCNTPSEGK